MAVAKLHRELLTRDALEDIIKIVTRADRSSLPAGLSMEGLVLWDDLANCWPGPELFEDVCARHLQFDPAGEYDIAAYLWPLLYVLMPVLPGKPQNLYWEIVLPNNGFWD